MSKDYSLNLNGLKFTVQENVNINKWNDAPAKRMLSIFDENKDGILSKDELDKISAKPTETREETEAISTQDVIIFNTNHIYEYDENGKLKEETITEDLTKTHKTTYGDTWQGLVEAYYPDLIEKCGGLWGKNGAIRALKIALADGNADILRKLFIDYKLPDEIKLPASINGVDRQDGTVKK